MNKKEEKPKKKEKEEIYIQEEDEVEEIDEEEAEIEEVDEVDSQIGIHILDDSHERKKLKKNKKDSESEEYSSEETPKDRNNSTQNENNENSNDNDNSNHNKRKRRKRKEFDGQSYKCPECGKSYFSMPALNTHRKTKHDFLRRGGGRGRGRPRKDPIIINSGIELPQIHEINKNQENIVSYSKIESKTAHLFEEENRKPIYGEIINRNTIIDIINNYKRSFHNVISFTDNKIFYQKIFDEWGNRKGDNEKGNNHIENMTFINLTNCKTPTKIGKSNDYINISDNNNLEGMIKDDNKKKTFDEAIVRYLKECSNLTNINFLKTIFFIIIIFRDGINNYFNEIKPSNSNVSLNGSENNYENIYTDKHNCNEEIPELINIIISKYFEPNSFFAIHKKDVQDIILHFFHWLYTFNYTDKKVTHA